MLSDVTLIVRFLVRFSAGGLLRTMCPLSHYHLACQPDEWREAPESQWDVGWQGLAGKWWEFTDCEFSS